MRRADAAVRVEPNRHGAATVRRGDIWRGVAERTGGLIPASSLGVLNGFPANSATPAGRRIKIVIGGE